MDQDRLQHWAYLAWTLAWLTAIASAFLVFAYGQSEVIRHTVIGPRSETVINWPLIAGLVVSSIYAFLFAVIMSALHRSVSLSEEVLYEVQTLRAGSGAGGKSQADSETSSK